MKSLNAIFFLAAVVGFQSAAYAIEPSAAIKVTTLLKAQTSWDGKPIVYPKGTPEVTGMVIDIAPGAETGWHLHPVNSFGVLLEGELEVTLKDGAKRRVKQGEALAEVANTLHNGRNVGTVPVKIVVFYAGEVGQVLSVKEPVTVSPPTPHPQ